MGKPVTVRGRKRRLDRAKLPVTHGSPRGTDAITEAAHKPVVRQAPHGVVDIRKVGQGRCDLRDVEHFGVEFQQVAEDDPLAGVERIHFGHRIRTRVRLPLNPSRFPAGRRYSAA
jgi:hypothetical protein